MVILSNSAKGDRFERALVTDLDEAGWATLRAPASGGGTDMDRPDVIALHAIPFSERLDAISSATTKNRSHSDVTSAAGNIGLCADVWALELKATGELPVYLSEAEVRALESWANDAGATPLIGISPDKRLSEYDTDRYIHIPDLDRTDSSNYVARNNTPYETFTDVFGD